MEEVWSSEALVNTCKIAVRRSLEHNLKRLFLFRILTSYNTQIEHEKFCRKPWVGLNNIIS